MLILTRKPGETVVIDDDVRITVLAVRGSQIKLGIEAPPEVRVNREEVLERDAAEAAGRAPGSGSAPRRPAPHDVPHRRHVGNDERSGSGRRRTVDNRSSAQRSSQRGSDRQGTPARGEDARAGDHGRQRSRQRGGRSGGRRSPSRGSEAA